MSNALFKYIPFAVDQVVSDIDQGRLALPDIQRPFVWKSTKVRDLLDSMYRGFPVGQMMFWKTDAEPGARQIGTGDKPQPVPSHLIVDGQQRLTSLYAVITGKPVRRDDYTEQRIAIAFNPFSEQFAIPDATTENQPEWLADITPLFSDFLDTIDEYTERLERVRGAEPSKQERRRIHGAFDRVHDLAKYTFSVVELDGSAEAEHVADVFVRINSEGIVLNQADFILTLMSVYWEKGRKQLEDFARAARTPSLSQASPFNWYLQPHPAQILRVTAALAFRRGVLKHVYTALRGKDIETGRSNAGRRREQFALLETAQEHVLDLTNWHEFLQCLERAGYRSGKMISSENAVVYAYAFWLIGRVDYGVPLDQLRETIARWFFMASITGRYSGSFESQVGHDLGLLPDRATGTADDFTRRLDHVVNETLTGDFWDIALPNSLATSASRSPSLLAYIAALNILDAEPLLSTGKIRSRLDPSVIAKKGIERHHLFPREHLRKQLGIRDAKQINQIANMALVEWSDNIKISDQPPHEYWPRQVADKRAVAGLTNDRLAQQVEWHALPEGWESMSYHDFLVVRRGLMATVVRRAFDLLRRPDYAPAYPPAPAPTARTSRTWTDYGVSVKQLIEVGVLSPGTQLLPSKDGLDAVAVVLPDGGIEFEDERHETPSGAGRAASGQPTNGWIFWVADTPDGPRSLADIREEYLRDK